MVLQTSTATQESMNPSIAVGGQIGDERLDRGDKLGSRHPAREAGSGVVEAEE